MTDARIVATNPADSSVVPVACNENGELLLAETSLDQFVEKDGDTMTGNLHLGDKIILNPDGSAQFAGGAVDVYDDGKVDLSGDVSLAGGLTGKTAAFSGQVTTGGNWSAATMGETFAARLSGASAFKFRGDIDSGSLVDFHVGGATVNDIVASIKHNGDAEFAGDFRVGAWPDNGCQMLAQGVVGTRRPSKGSTASLCSSSGALHFVLSGGTFLDGIQTTTSYITKEGNAVFNGDVVVGSRNKKWMLVESGGICHLVEQTRSAEVDTADLVSPEESTPYPELRNLPQEIDQLRSVVTALLTEVQRVEEKLRMAPESGWPVWDGSD